MPREAYKYRDPIDEWLDEYPLPDAEHPGPPEPTRAALYQRWPSGNEELLSEFETPTLEFSDKVIVSDEGFVVTYDRVRCGKTNELATIRARDGSVVRTLNVADVFTRNDQLWLCRGAESDVRFALHEGIASTLLRGTVLLTDTKWDDPNARFATVDIDPATGEVPPPKRNLCPAPLIVTAEPDDSAEQSKTDAEGNDVVALDSSALLARALTREIPEYPDVAAMARIAGTVRARVLVGRDGRVEDVAIVKPLPFGMDAAVRSALVHWRFEPYLGSAGPVRFSGTIAFRFRIMRNFQPLTTPTITCFTTIRASS